MQFEHLGLNIWVKRLCRRMRKRERRRGRLGRVGVSFVPKFGRARDGATRAS